MTERGRPSPDGPVLLTLPHLAKSPASRKPFGCKFDTGLDARQLAPVAGAVGTEGMPNFRCEIETPSFRRAHRFSLCLFSPTHNDPRHVTRPFRSSPPARPF